MIYQGHTYNNMREVFDKALDIAKHNTEESKDFLKTYTLHILAENSSCNTFEEALFLAKSNLIYFSGYCDNKTSELIYNTYNPIYIEK